MVFILLVIHSLSPGVSGQVALAALVALIALVIYHLTIDTQDPPNTHQHSFSTMRQRLHAIFSHIIYHKK